MRYEIWGIWIGNMRCEIWDIRYEIMIYENKRHMNMYYEIWDMRYEIWDMRIWDKRYEIWDMRFEIWDMR